MTAHEDLPAIIDRLTRRLTPGSAPVMRKATDSKPPNGVREGYGTRVNTNASAKSLRGNRPPYAGHYRPRSGFAGQLPPATELPSWEGRVNPTPGRRFSGSATVTREGKREPSAALLQAKANSESAGYRAVVSEQSSFAIAAGELPLPGIAVGVEACTRTETLTERDARMVARHPALDALEELAKLITG